MSRHSQRGFTLIELLTVLGALGILMALSQPLFRDSRQNAVMLSTANSMLGSLHYARSVSLLRNVPVVVCLSSDMQRCRTTSAAPTGWLLLAASGNTATRITRGDVPPEAPLRKIALPGGIRATASRSAVTYWPVSRSGTTSTFSFCPAAPTLRGRSVIVSQSGRPRLAVLAVNSGLCRGA